MRSAIIAGFKALVAQARANKLEYCKSYVEKHEETKKATPKPAK